MHERKKEKLKREEEILRQGERRAVWVCEVFCHTRTQIMYVHTRVSDVQGISRGAGTEAHTWDDVVEYQASKARIV